MKVITVGRSSDNDIVVNDSKASRYHLQIIQHDNGDFSLSDFGSTNGTYVNGKKVCGEIPLRTNDIVRIGNTTLPWNNYFISAPQPHVQPQIESSIIPPKIDINKKGDENIHVVNESSDVRKRGDDFSVGFMRNLGDNMGEHVGNTLGCIVSIVIIGLFLLLIFGLRSC